MFSFHKPKVYRSSTGCCICKAKSSSSRFTDSKKYEEDFLECFQLSSRRQGEICNACVLLVKRWKKLPDGPKRNWRHVVDARAGPGMKSMTKFKSKQKKQLMLMEHLGENKGRHHDGNRRDRDDFEREFSPTLSDKSDDMDIVDYTNMMTGGDSPQNGNNPNNGGNEMGGIHGDSGESSPRLSHSPTGSDCEDNVIGNTVGVLVGSRRRKASKIVLSRRRRRRQEERSENSVNAAAKRVSVGFIDLDYWTKESICCGVVFRGKNGEVLIDVGRGCRLKPCNISLQQQKVRPHLVVAASIASAADQLTVLQPSVVAVQSSNSNGDNSSDSGYDDTTVAVGNAAVVGNSAMRAANETTVLQLAPVRRKPVGGIAGGVVVSADSNCDD